MLSGNRRAGALVLLLAHCAFAQAQVTAPGLLPTETYGVTRNGCGIVLETGGAESLTVYGTLPDGSQGELQLSPAEYIGRLVWSGECVNGLAQGWGKLGEPENVGNEFMPEVEMGYGRDLLTLRTGPNDRVFTLRANGAAQSISLHNMGDDGTGGPVWGAENDFTGGSSILAHDVAVRTNTTNCYIDTREFRRCRDAGYAVYGVTVQDTSTGTVTDHWCPDPRTAEGCEALWQQFMDEHHPTLVQDLQRWREQRESALKQYAELSADWIAQGGAAPLPVAPAGEMPDIALCRQVENASDIPERLRALPEDNLNLRTRGIVAAADFMIATYSACLPHPEAQKIVGKYVDTRNATLRTCRQLSSTDNCMESPFGLLADLERQQAELAELDRQRAEFDAQQQAQDAQDLDAAMGVLLDAVGQYIESEAGGASGGGASDGGGGDSEDACNDFVCR